MTQAGDVGRGGVTGEVVGEQQTPLYATILVWLEGLLRSQGYGRPLCKRLAVLVSGLVASDKATIGQISTSVKAQAVSAATEESIARRLQRIAADARVDPARLLAAVFGGPVLAQLLAAQVGAHAANAGSGVGHHRRFIGVRIVLDESSQDEHVHIVVAGLAVGGLVLPLAVRTWAQNAPLPQGEYWVQVSSLLQDVAAMLPPDLRDHVLLVADRAYGVARMLDVASALGWGWLLRVQGQIRVRLPDGTDCAVGALVPRRGTRWSGGLTAADPDDIAAVDAPLAVFKGAGWRRSRVEAIWTATQDAPWLLVTSLTGATDRLAAYAGRWAIERLFLSWKSHGWDIEASGIHHPARLGRLLSGLAIATLWRLVIALPRAQALLADLADRAARRDARPHQLPLPLPDTTPATTPRPWAAKFSLFTWGIKVARTVPLHTHTPARCWTLPLWDAPTWSQQCRRTYLHNPTSAHPPPQHLHLPFTHHSAA